MAMQEHPGGRLVCGFGLHEACGPWRDSSFGIGEEFPTSNPVSAYLHRFIYHFAWCVSFVWLLPCLTFVSPSFHLRFTSPEMYMRCGLAIIVNIWYRSHMFTYWYGNSSSALCRLSRTLCVRIHASMLVYPKSDSRTHSYMKSFVLQNMSDFSLYAFSQTWFV